jgi:O-antigen ligase
MPRWQERLFPSSLKNWPQRLSLLLLAGSVSLALISIAASQILLAAAIAAALVQWSGNRGQLRLPAALLAAVVVLFLWTLAVMLASSGSLHDGMVRKFFLFSILLIVPILAFGNDRLTWIYTAVFVLAGFSAVVGLVQFGIDPHRDALNRIKGLMSIWMTYSGLLMLALVALVAYAAALGWKKHRWVVPLVLLLIAALYLSQTRSTELGACAGIAVILLLKRPRWLLGLLILVLALYLASPAGIQQRLRGAWNLQDDNTRNRIEIYGTAVRLIEAHPWMGVGQKVSRVALQYRGTQEFPDYMYLHMHNNFLQIAAERGIPGLIIWMWFMFQLVWQGFRVFRSSGGAGSAAFIALAAIGGWFAMLAAGMFEYNFGDSEVLTLFLFVMSAPYAVRVTSRE